MGRKPIYPRWFRWLCSIARLFFDRLRVSGQENIPQPCVFVARHMDDYGPLAAYLYVPAPFHLWTYYPFLEPKAFVRQMVNFTLTKRLGMPLFPAKLCAHILKYPVTWACRSVGMIPVYRGRRDVLKTMDSTVDCLEKGENVLIFPDVSYSDKSRSLGEFYAGFLRLGKMVAERTGRRLVFQPVAVSAEDKTMRFAKPIVYDPSQPLPQERERILKELRHELQSTEFV